MDGVGDYALALARGLRAEFNIDSSFVVTDPAWKGSQVDGFAVHRLPGHTADELFEALRQERAGTVLLHYEGYAYAKRGCPNWLVEALERWHEANERLLLTVFHELYASGPPWTSSFWLSHHQRSLVTRLARLSGQNFTSLALYARRLEQMGNSANGIAVFSSIGEPLQTPLPLTSRRRRMVVFGTGGRRLQVYERSSESLIRICRELDIEEIWDIGRESDSHPVPNMGVPVITCGQMSGPAVREILLDSIAGVIDYPADMLAKSTIFAAYCAHRMMPLVAGYGSADDSDGLVLGAQYQLVDDLRELDLSSAQRIADNAFDWYQTHRLAVHTQRLAAHLETVTPEAREVLVHA
jgi:hypothetical protein